MNINAVILKECKKFNPRNVRILFFIRDIEEMESYLKQLTDKFILGMINRS